MDLNRSFWRRLRPVAILRSLLSLLPQKLRFMLYRQLVTIPTKDSGEITIQIAESREDLEAAFRLLYKEYVRAGFMKPTPEQIRVTPYHALPSTTTIVAKSKGKVIGTVSIVRDSAFGLPLDKIFDVQHLRRQGARVAEISALAIDVDHRNNSGAVMFPLMKYVYMYCTEFFGVDHMVIAVNPKHIEFYQSILLFKLLPAKPVTNYDFVDGAPAVGGVLSMRESYLSYARVFSARPQHKNLFAYFTERRSGDGLIFPGRGYHTVSDPVMTPENLDYFFNRLSKVFANLSDRDRSVIAGFYQNTKYAEVLPTGNVSYLAHQRREIRFDVKCAARAVFSESRTIQMTVKEVSLQGFQALLSDKLRFGSTMSVNIAVGTFEIADVKAWPVWSNEENVFGFRIVESCPRWKSFIEHLRRDLDREVTAAAA